MHRTNFPSIRGDLDNAWIKKLAWASGCELIVDAKGPSGSLGFEATRAGCPTLVVEAGEALKIERTVVESGVRYVKNILVALSMLAGRPAEPAVQVRVHRSKWIRADHGGIVEFHVLPGELVRKGQPLATLTDLLRKPKGAVCAPAEGIVLGMTTLPCVAPGNPVCHLAFSKTPLSMIEEALKRLPEKSLHNRLRTDLGTNIRWSDPPA
jgi:predicted deacylase